MNRNRTMCKTLLLSAILFLLTLPVAAQNPRWEKYSGQEGVTYVYISSAMFQMLPLGADYDTNGVKLSDIRDKLSSLQVVSAKTPESSRQLRSEILQMVARSYEVLMQVIDDGARVTFYAKQEGEMINDLVMVSDSDTGFTVVQLLGCFTTSDIQNITKSAGH